jgi:hypothetical protein
VTTGQETTRLPVRSALFKQRTGGLVVRWVTTSEYPLLYVFALVFAWAILVHVLSISHSRSWQINCIVVKGLKTRHLLHARYFYMKGRPGIII